MSGSDNSLASDSAKNSFPSGFWGDPCSNISFPGRAKGTVVHKAGCVTHTRQKFWPPLRFLTMTSFDSVTHHWDGELAAVCVGQP